MSRYFESILAHNSVSARKEAILVTFRSGNVLLISTQSGLLSNLNFQLMSFLKVELALGIYITPAHLHFGHEGSKLRQNICNFTSIDFLCFLLNGVVRMFRSNWNERSQWLD